MWKKEEANHFLRGKVNSIFFLVAEGNKLCGREPEVEFVTHVTHSGGVKLLLVV